MQVGDTRTLTSNCGLGSITAPAVGSVIVLPVMSKASGSSASTFTFTIAAWVMVEVNAGCKKQHCEGRVIGPALPPPSMRVSTGGTVQPPATFAQFLTYGGLVD